MWLALNLRHHGIPVHFLPVISYIACQEAGGRQSMSATSCQKGRLYKYAREYRATVQSLECLQGSIPPAATTLEKRLQAQFRSEGGVRWTSELLRSCVGRLEDLRRLHDRRLAR